MLSSMTTIIAGLTVPMEITTDSKAMLWMFPLLLAVALVYKATKVRVIFPLSFAKDVGILFVTMSVLMSAAAVGLIVLTQLITA